MPTMTSYNQYTGTDCEFGHGRRLRQALVDFA
jgi:hypothetical protein